MPARKARPEFNQRKARQEKKSKAEKVAQDELRRKERKARKRENKKARGSGSSSSSINSQRETTTEATGSEAVVTDVELDQGTGLVNDLSLLTALPDSEPETDVVDLTIVKEEHEEKWLDRSEKHLGDQTFHPVQEEVDWEPKTPTTSKGKEKELVLYQGSNKSKSESEEDIAPKQLFGVPPKTPVQRTPKRPAEVQRGSTSFAILRVHLLKEKLLQCSYPLISYILDELGEVFDRYARARLAIIDDEEAWGYDWKYLDKAAREIVFGGDTPEENLASAKQIIERVIVHFNSLKMGSEDTKQDESQLSPSTRKGMPVRKLRGAPHFDDQQPEELLRYFEELDGLFEAHGVKSNKDKKDYLVFYVPAKVERQWKSMKEYLDVNVTYEDFKKALIEEYPAASGMKVGSMKRLEQVLRENQRLSEDDLEALLNFKREFKAETLHLKDILANSMLVRYFLGCLEKEFRARVLATLESGLANRQYVDKRLASSLTGEVQQPRRHDDPYTLDEVIETTVRLARKNGPNVDDAFVISSRSKNSSASVPAPVTIKSKTEIMLLEKLQATIDA